MSYTVLARKWRPRRFGEMVGQQHVVRALVNSLAAERLHHAYLFAGTRGVGKTTLARILAKALNCAEGIVAEPCGECDACKAIDGGRFVDLIEVDAASRTRVDDTRELMENTQYAPAEGRFKVYLIDEVHMLSNHSFNALLKTLEEPPPHIKFLLATTDPQKLPVTVLSRCLQFNLKRLTVAEIHQQLEKIHQDEEFDADDASLKALARAADGSMRDGLSLLDQAIAFSAGDLTADAVSAMLGTIDRDHVIRLAQALAAQDGSALMAEVAVLDERAPDYGAVLDELMGIMQRIAVLQLVGDGNGEGSPELPELASAMSAEDVQLYYQIALQGRRDLPVSRDHRSAFEMTLLRMLAFRPDSGQGSAERAGHRTVRTGATKGAPARQNPPGTGPAAKPARPADHGDRATQARAAAVHLPDPDTWHEFIKEIGLSGAPRQLAEHCAVQTGDGGELRLLLAADNTHLNTERVRNRLLKQIQERLPGHISVVIEEGDPSGTTPAQMRAESESKRIRRARASIESDPTVKAIQAQFDAVLEVDSIRPRENEPAR